jgi:hypothetical protein
MNDKENIEQNSLQQGQVIRNTKREDKPPKLLIFPRNAQKRIEIKKMS